MSTAARPGFNIPLRVLTTAPQSPALGRALPPPRMKEQGGETALPEPSEMWPRRAGPLGSPRRRQALVSPAANAGMEPRARAPASPPLIPRSAEKSH